MPKKIVHLVIAGLLLLSACAHAEPTGFRAYQLPGHGTLQLSVPHSWNDQMRQRQQDMPPTILFTPERGYAFNVQVTLLWPPKPDAVMPGIEEIRRTVSKAADDAKPQAAETAITIEEIPGSSGNGYYFAVTDRAPKPGEFKYMTQGMLRVGELMLAFTVLSNDGAAPAVKDALTMLKSAQQIGTEKH